MYGGTYSIVITANVEKCKFPVIGKWLINCDSYITWNSI